MILTLSPVVSLTSFNNSQEEKIKDSVITETVAQIRIQTHQEKREKTTTTMTTRKQPWIPRMHLFEIDDQPWYVEAL